MDNYSLRIQSSLAHSSPLFGSETQTSLLRNIPTGEERPLYSQGETTGASFMTIRSNLKKKMPCTFSNYNFRRVLNDQEKNKGSSFFFHGCFE